MGKILSTLFALIFAAGSVYFLLFQLKVVGPTVCEKTLQYSLGNFDTRFGLTREEFIVYLEQAEKVWETPLNKNLFELEGGAKFTVNLIFDERQRQTIEEKKFRYELENIEGRIQEVSLERQTLLSGYQSAVSEYGILEKDFRTKLTTYNSEVDGWNEKGGAPKGVYEELTDKQRRLSEDAAFLDEKRIELNKLVLEVNRLGMQGSILAKRHNENAVTYTSVFGSPRQFNQGDYDGKSISIYQFDAPEHLVLVLAHELGHALELRHLSNTESVMYYLMDAQDLENVRLTEEDLAALRQKCRL
ncbi:MAG: matrixin family metalloprotease [bacterium]|nr:matrixin family metalloprotease [bacterium]